MKLAAKKVAATGLALQAVGQGPPVEEIVVIALVIANSVNALHRERRGKFRIRHRRFGNNDHQQHKRLK